MTQKYYTITLMVMYTNYVTGRDISYNLFFSIIITKETCTSNVFVGRKINIMQQYNNNNANGKGTEWMDGWDGVCEGIKLVGKSPEHCVNEYEMYENK
jgi:hypothetical protein